MPLIVYDSGSNSQLILEGVDNATPELIIKSFDNSGGLQDQDALQYQDKDGNPMVTISGNGNINNGVGAADASVNTKLLAANYIYSNSRAGGPTQDAPNFNINQDPGQTPNMFEINMDYGSGGTFVYIYKNGNLSSPQGLCDGIQYETPLEGATVNASVDRSSLILDPAAGRTAVTINLPASPSDGYILHIIAGTHTIIGLTLTPAGGDTVVGAITTLVSGAAGSSYIYRLANTTWYRR